MTSTPAPAIAVMRDGSRIPLSDPLDDARRLFRDHQYDMDEVVAIELSEGSPAPALPPYQIPQTFHQEQLPL